MKIYIFKFIMFIFIIVSTVSCTSTKYVEVPVETIKTEYKNTIQYDSVYIHDSINRYISNDTVYCIKYKYLERYHNLVDTVCKIDSINTPIIQEVEITKEVNNIYWWLKILMYIGVVFILLAILRLYGKFR